MEWKWFNETSYPTEDGWYVVMIEGDSETIDGFTLYDFPDYETFGYWTCAEPDEFEDFEGGYKGSFSCRHDEESDSVMAFCGPFKYPPFNKNKPL